MAKSTSFESMRPNERNPRKITQKQLSELKRSLEEFGDLGGIVVNADGTLISGHQRFEAMKAADGVRVVDSEVLDLPTPTGTIERAWVVMPSGERFSWRRVDWDDQKAQLAMLAANKQGGEWAMDKLSDAFLEMADWDVDLDLTGFAASERHAFEPTPSDESAANASGAEDEDAQERMHVESRCKFGDVWLLGKHRLMCGDSTNPQHVEKLMNGQKADLVFTSPPYMQQRHYGKMISDWRQMMSDVFSILPLKDDAQILVNLGIVHRDWEWVPYWDEWIVDMKDMGYRRFAFYVWSKRGGTVPTISHGRLSGDWEPIFHFNKAERQINKTKKCIHAGLAAKGQVTGGRKSDGKLLTWDREAINDNKIASAVINANTARGSKWSHPAQFSVELCKEIIEPFTSASEIIYEPFGGAGTNIIAAEETNRVCLAMELEAKYCDMALTRWEQYTGGQAILLGAEGEQKVTDAP